MRTDEIRHPVYVQADASWTIARIDEVLGRQPPKPDSRLSAWYVATSHIAIASMAIEDLTRAIRQRIHLPIMLVEAMKRLEEDRWAGYLYPGELAAALGSVPETVWRECSEVRRRASAFGIRFLDKATVRDRSDLEPEHVQDIRSEVERWLRAARSAEATQHYLVLESAGGSDMWVPIDDFDVVTIGSAEGATINIPPEVAGLEPIHARIHNLAVGFRLMAIGAVLVNGRRVAHVFLSTGDRMHMGSARLRFEEIAPTRV